MSALMTAGALVLATGAVATTSQSAAAAPAASAASGSSLNEARVAGQVSATAKASDLEVSTQTRKATVRATAKLNSKVKATASASAQWTVKAQASASAQATRYAPTYGQALAEAQGIAKKAAHERAVVAAKARSGKLALARAKQIAAIRAKAKAKAALRKRFGTLVLQRAAAQKGKPYRYGATGPRAFDCSGLITYVMKGVGVKLPRTSSAMARKAKRVSKASKQPGDLIFFTSGSRVYHVAVYAGGGKIWHSPKPGRSVTKDKIWTSSYRVGRAA
jgi:cell wall-associated NlpC family hydrolase